MILSPVTHQEERLGAHQAEHQVELQEGHQAGLQEGHQVLYELGGQVGSLEEARVYQGGLLAHPGCLVPSSLHLGHIELAASEAWADHLHFPVHMKKVFMQQTTDTRE